MMIVMVVLECVGFVSLASRVVRGSDTFMRRCGRSWGFGLILAGALGASCALGAQSPAAPDAENTTAKAPGATAAAVSDFQATAKDDSAGALVHHLAADVSVALPGAWQEFEIGSVPPPTAIATYA